MSNSPLDDWSSRKTSVNRFEQLELAVSHVQHDLESLSKSVNSILHRLSALETRLTQFEQHAFAPREEQDLPDPLDEKPPHY